MFFYFILSQCHFPQLIVTEFIDSFKEFYQILTMMVSQFTVAEVNTFQAAILR